MNDNIEDIAKYLFEMGQLKRVKRSGWWIAGVRDPESVAEHAFRTAIIGYVLAQMEGADPEKTALMCLIHDNHEARLNDQHRIGRRYVPSGDANARAFDEQTVRLPAAAGPGLVALFKSFEAGDSHEAVLARDADQLECLVQAREYQAQGFKDVDDWIQGCRAALRSASAQAIGDACIALEPSAWWEGLKATR